MLYCSQSTPMANGLKRTWNGQYQQYVGEICDCRPAATYAVPKSILSRHMVDKNNIADDNVKFYGHAFTFMKQLEAELVQHCLQLKSMYFGLCVDDLQFVLSQVAKPTLLHSNLHSMDWSIFATAHGKGPVDGVGGL